MSRIGRQPIKLPKEVDFKINSDNLVTVKGPNGTLTKLFNRDMKIVLEGAQIIVSRPSEERLHKSLHGLTRTLINNMVIGVTSGFEKALVIEGVGYRGQKQGKKLILSLGYSHPVEIEEIPGITIDVPNPNRVVVKGIDNQMVGEFAANIRSKREPEVYKGKGIRYETEKIRRKEGKTGKGKK